MTPLKWAPKPQEIHKNYFRRYLGFKVSRKTGLVKSPGQVYDGYKLKKYIYMFFWWFWSPFKGREGGASP